MKGQIATFQNGVRRESTRCPVVTHGWLASGRLSSGKAWSLHGFSTVGALHAWTAMRQQVFSFIAPGSTIEFAGVVSVEPVTQRVPA